MNITVEQNCTELHLTVSQTVNELHLEAVQNVTELNLNYGEVATAILTDTDGNVISTTEIAGGETDTIIAPDANIELNGVQTFTAQSGGVKNINLIDSDGATVEVDAVSGDDVTLDIKQTDLILKVDTTKAGTSASNQFTIPTTGGGYNYDVETSEQLLTGRTGNTTLVWAVGGIYEVRIRGVFPRMFFNNGGDRLKLLEVLNWGVYGSSLDQSNAFQGCENLIELGKDIDFANFVIEGLRMFEDTKMLVLPNKLTLKSLIQANSMFRSTVFTSLPPNMTLDNLIVGNLMFFNAQLEFLHDNITLKNLSNGTAMFRSSKLNAIGESVTLENLEIALNMFRDCFLTDLPPLIKFQSLTDGGSIFIGNTINTTRYSQLLIDMEAENPNNNVTFHGGSSKYNTAGGVARAALVARGWIITDGGAE